MKYVSNIVEGNILYDSEKGQELYVQSINPDGSCIVANNKTREYYQMPREFLLEYVSPVDNQSEYDIIIKDDKDTKYKIVNSNYDPNFSYSGFRVLLEAENGDFVSISASLIKRIK